MDENKQQGKACGCSHHKVVPISIILIGLIFLLGTFQIVTIAAVNVVWPILLIVIGVAKLSKGKCKCC